MEMFILSISKSLSFFIKDINGEIRLKKEFEDGIGVTCEI